MGSKILNGLIFLCAAAAIYAAQSDQDYLFGILKPLTTILIILLPLLFGKKPFRKYDYLIFAGLIFSLFGDVFLLKESRFVQGLASFFVAHVLFTIAFIQFGGFKKYWSVLIGLTIFGIGYFALIYSSLGELLVPVFFYFAVIITMAWQGISLYLWNKQKGFLLVAIAVLLFMFSDSMIALNKFVVPFELSPLVILSTYWLSIALLANSVLVVDDVVK